LNIFTNNSSHCGYEWQKVVFATFCTLMVFLLCQGEAIAECEDRYFAPNDNFNQRPLKKPHDKFQDILIAADGGDPVAQRGLGIFYKTGYLVSTCVKKSQYWYLKAAFNGDLVAKKWVDREQSFDRLRRIWPDNIITGIWHGPGRLVCNNHGCDQLSSISSSNNVPSNSDSAPLASQTAVKPLPGEPSVPFQKSRASHGDQQFRPIQSSSQGGMISGGSLNGSFLPSSGGGMIHGGPLSGSILPGPEGGMVIGGPLSGTFMPGSEGGMIHGGPLTGSIFPNNGGGMIIGGPLSGTILPAR
jgi:hypothetical protein